MAFATLQQHTDEEQIVLRNNALFYPNGSGEGMIREKLSFINALGRERDGPTTDFEIACAGKTFRVHRILVGMHSEYLERRCGRVLRDTGEYRMELKDVPPAAVKAMIDYMYTFNYPDPVIAVDRSASAAANLEPPSILEAHSQIFNLGDEADIEGLSSLALTKFRDYLKAGLPADNNQEAMEAFLSNMADELIPATEHMYKNFTEDDGMREAATRVWSTSSFREHAERQAFEALLAAVPMFATELIDEMTGTPGSYIGKRRPSD